MKLRATVRVLIVTGVSFMSPVAWACGFEDPAAMQTGVLNWIYPKALYVNTAVWQAQLDGRIGSDPQLQTANKLFINPGYRRAQRTLLDFGNRLSGEPETQSFVVLLMEAMLWSRISIVGGKSTLTPHINAPADAEAVVITHRVVLEAITQGRISPAAAIEAGLLRFYGSETAVARTIRSIETSFGPTIPDIASQ